MRRFILTTAAFLATVAPAVSQVCVHHANIGGFDVLAEDPEFDGVATRFTYCIRGHADPALSDWLLGLDVTCIQPGDVLSCVPQPCFHQYDDPHFAADGIKFDDVTLGPGDQACYSFSLQGDWTGDAGDVIIGLKADGNVSVGVICGPTCAACGADLQVIQNGQLLYVNTRVVHHRPPAAFTEVVYRITDADGVVVHSWIDGPIELAQGQRYNAFGPVPNQPRLPAGTYRLTLEMAGMGKWVTRSTSFTLTE